ncbi:hypothetical protein SynBIOSE41_01417 [Synechococcus sp. BIOS-E4-1]|nr:hypothetical protein SynBIOSE41_01417 [Synechococcus sp. BIOS-E4-1]
MDDPGPYTLNMTPVFVSSSAGCSGSTSILGNHAGILQ